MSIYIKHSVTYATITRAATGFWAKSLDSQKKFTRSEKITGFQIFVSKFAVLL